MEYSALISIGGFLEHDPISTGAQPDEEFDAYLQSVLQMNQEFDMLFGALAGALKIHDGLSVIERAQDLVNLREKMKESAQLQRLKENPTFGGFL